MFHLIMGAGPTVPAESGIKFLAEEKIDQTSITRMIFRKDSASSWVIAVLRTNFFE